jgi:aldehyde:ferredoxin oxidoreductase
VTDSGNLPPVYGGEVLHVDLERGETRRESIATADARRFLGGGTASRRN